MLLKFTTILNFKFKFSEFHFIPVLCVWRTFISLVNTISCQFLVQKLFLLLLNIDIVYVTKLLCSRTIFKFVQIQHFLWVWCCLPPLVNTITCQYLNLKKSLVVILFFQHCVTKPLCSTFSSIFFKYQIIFCYLHFRVATGLCSRKISKFLEIWQCLCLLHCPYLQ